MSVPVTAVGSPILDGVDLEAARRFAADTARAAGEIIQRTLRRGFTVSSKGSAGDVVTSLDLATERYIVDRIQAEFPLHRILSEEAGLVGAASPDGQDSQDSRGGQASEDGSVGDSESWLWLVDPLDGTNNVAVGLSMYVVGMTLCRGGVPVLGVIHDPVTGQSWTAVKDLGLAGVEGVDVGRRGRTRGRRLVLAWTQGYDVRVTDSAPSALKFLLESKASRVLQLWTPLLSWAMLARGDIDGFVGYRAGLLDLSGGALIAAESGLLVTDLDGEPFRHRFGEAGATRDFVAGSPDVVRQLLALVKDVPRVEKSLRQMWA